MQVVLVVPHPKSDNAGSCYPEVRKIKKLDNEYKIKKIP